MIRAAEHLYTCATDDDKQCIWIREKMQVSYMVTTATANLLFFYYYITTFISCRLDYCNSLLYILADTLLRKLQSVQNATARLILAREAVIISRRYYTNSTGDPSESASSSKWHAWFASRCPGRRLSTWPTTAVSCPTALGAQLMFRLAWCRQHSAVMATELLQPRDLACGTLFQSNCVILSPDITYGLF